MKLVTFLDQFQISKETFETANISWDELLQIKKDFSVFSIELEDPAKFLVEKLHRVDKVHSVRYRIKDPEHLLEKIVRKKLENPLREINLFNYKSEITDLIGIRLLHLFKEDWISIHNFITDNWELFEPSVAYCRKGDNDEYINLFKGYGCDVKEHPFGYRSVHYLIKTSPSKTTYIAEIQVRTIFEEAWSEIDHSVRYPYDLQNVLLRQFLVIFNRLAGSADEMGSYVSYLKSELAKTEEEHRLAIDEKVSLINDLKEKLKNLELKPSEYKIFISELDSLSKDLMDNNSIRINPIINNIFNNEKIELPNIWDSKSMLNINDLIFYNSKFKTPIIIEHKIQEDKTTKFSVSEKVQNTETAEIKSDPKPADEHSTEVNQKISDKPENKVAQKLKKKILTSKKKKENRNEE